jgi:hypothetical protein
MKRFSEMTLMELYIAMDRFLKEKEEALRQNWQSQADMLERKYYMAKAYTLSPDNFPPGRYRVVGHDLPFNVEYLNGLMAWGSMGEEKEISFLISMLKKDTE